MNCEQKTYSFIILTYNSSGIIEDCLNSIRNNFKFRDYDIYIIDNSSEDIEKTKMIALNYNCTIIEKKENDGYARGNNTILNKSSADFLVFMNPDSRIKVWGVDSFRRIENSKNFLWGPNLITSEGNNELSFYYDWEFQTPFNQLILLKLRRFLNWFDKDKMWINGPFFIIKRGVFERVNGFYEGTFLYNEEYLLKKRLINRYGDYKAVFLPNLEVIHLKKKSRINLNSMKISIDSAINSCQEIGYPQLDYINMRVRQLKWRKLLNFYNPVVSKNIQSTIDYLKWKKSDFI